VNVGDVATGLGLAAYGIGFYAGCRWYVRDDGRMRRLAECRWWLDRWRVRKVRKGRMTRDQWFARFTRQQRGLVKWGFTPVTVLWLIACAMKVVQGLRG
jgi:hypothetical protein